MVLGRRTLLIGLVFLLSACSAPAANPPTPSPVPSTSVPATVAPPTDVPATSTSVATSTKSPTQEDMPTSTPRPTYTISITNIYDGEGYIRVVIALRNANLYATSFESLQTEEYSLIGDNYKIAVQLLIDDLVSEVKNFRIGLDADTEILINNINDVDIK